MRSPSAMGLRMTSSLPMSARRSAARARSGSVGSGTAGLLAAVAGGVAEEAAVLALRGGHPVVAVRGLVGHRLGFGDRRAVPVEGGGQLGEAAHPVADVRVGGHRCPSSRSRAAVSWARARERSPSLAARRAASLLAWMRSAVVGHMA